MANKESVCRDVLATAVNKGISDVEISDLLKLNLKPAELCKKIVQISAKKDGKDNTSCVILKVLPQRKKTFLDYLKSLFK